MMGRRIAALFAGALLGAGTLCAQGVLSGSLESSSIYDVLPGSSYNGFHANNYLKLDYRSAGSFYAGVQAEWYPSPLPGFDPALLEQLNALLEAHPMGPVLIDNGRYFRFRLTRGSYRDYVRQDLYRPDSSLFVVGSLQQFAAKI